MECIDYYYAKHRFSYGLLCVRQPLLAEQSKSLRQAGMDLRRALALREHAFGVSSYNRRYSIPIGQTISTVSYQSGGKERCLWVTEQ